MKKRFIVYHAIVVNSVHVAVRICLIGRLFLVGRGLGRTLLLNVDTPPSSPSLNRIETNIANQRKLSTGSSPSRTSSDDDSRHSNSQINRIATQTNYRSSSTHLPAFKMMSISGNICPRCSKTVYSAEEIKAAGKVIFFRFTNSKILFLDIS